MEDKGCWTKRPPSVKELFIQNSRRKKKRIESQEVGVGWQLASGKWDQATDRKWGQSQKWNKTTLGRDVPEVRVWRKGLPKSRLLKERTLSVPKDLLSLYREGLRPIISHKPWEFQETILRSRMVVGQQVGPVGWTFPGEKHLWLPKGSEFRAIGSEVSKHRKWDLIK